MTVDIQLSTSIVDLYKTENRQPCQYIICDKKTRTCTADDDSSKLLVSKLENRQQTKEEMSKLY